MSLRSARMPKTGTTQCDPLRRYRLYSRKRSSRGSEENIFPGLESLFECGWPGKHPAFALDSSENIDAEPAARLPTRIKIMQLPTPNSDQVSVRNSALLEDSAGYIRMPSWTAADFSTLATPDPGGFRVRMCPPGVFAVLLAIYSI